MRQHFINSNTKLYNKYFTFVGCIIYNPITTIKIKKKIRNGDTVDWKSNYSKHFYHNKINTMVNRDHLICNCYSLSVQTPVEELFLSFFLESNFFFERNLWNWVTVIFPILLFVVKWRSLILDVFRWFFKYFRTPRHFIFPN